MIDLKAAPDLVDAVVDALNDHVVLTRGGVRPAAVASVRAVLLQLERSGYAVTSAG